MKTRISTYFFAACLIFLAAGFDKAEAKVSMDKVLADKTFEVNKDALLLIDHEFGNVNIQNWDKNNIFIKVTVHIESNSEEQAQKILDKIQLSISGDKTKVSAICNLGNSFSNKTDFSIDMEVFTPKTINLQMKHKFGSVYIETLEGTAKIKSEYGSVQIMSLLNNDTRLDVSFGSASIGKMGNGNLNISYSNLVLDEGTMLAIDSKYSEISLKSVQNGNLSIEGGSVEINNIAELTLVSKFSTIEVSNLNSSLKANTEYGSLEVDYVKSGFSTLDIENKFGSVELGIDKSATFDVNVQTSFGDFDYPESLAHFSNKFTSSTGSNYSGKIGNSAGGGSKLIAHTSYGGIEISAK
jgi:hypothetical protein